MEDDALKTRTITFIGAKRAVTVLSQERDFFPKKVWVNWRKDDKVTKKVKLKYK